MLYLKQWLMTTTHKLLSISINFNLLSTNPYLGVKCHTKNIDKDCRVLIFQNYLIIYEVTQNSIIIARILNSRQDYQNGDFSM